LIQKFTYNMAARFNRPWRETSFVKHEIGEFDYLFVVRLRRSTGRLEAFHKAQPPNRLTNEPLFREARSKPYIIGGIALRLAQRVPASSMSFRLTTELGRSASFRYFSTAINSSAMSRTVLLAMPCRGHFTKRQKIAR
jgi:hypothetical protein